MTKHLTRRDLLLYVDGELPRRRARDAQEHIHSCWNCRRELEKLEEDIGAIVDAQRRSFLPSMPPPAQPWQDFQELAATVPAPRFGPRAWRGVTQLVGSASRTPLRWAMAFAALGCIVLVAVWLSPAPLSAENVIRKLGEADSQRSRTAPAEVIRQRVRIEETDRHHPTKRSVQVESWKAGSRALWNGDIGNLRRRYQERGLDAALPLSASAWEGWLREPGARVEVDSGASGGLVLQSEISGRDLEAVSLRIRPDTWHVDSMRLTFSDSVFDINELDFAVLRKDELSADTLAALEVPVLRSSNAVAAGTARTAADVDRPTGVDLAEVEIEVEFRLHQIGGDLSEPIEVRKAARSVVIKASGASDERKRQLTEIFGSVPEVQLELEQPTTANGASPPVAVTGSNERREPDKQLAGYFPDSDAQENFTRTVLAQDAAILARLYALRNLGERWPPDAEAGLSAEGHEKLRRIVQDHKRSLQQETPQLKRILDPLIARFCGAETTAAAEARPAPWRDAAAAALRTARTLDSDLRALLTTSGISMTVESACPQMKTALATLETSTVDIPVP
jgi:hypothetical protein